MEPPRPAPRCGKADPLRTRKVARDHTPKKVVAKKVVPKKVTKKVVEVAAVKVAAGEG